MSRLTTEDIRHITENLEKTDQLLKDATGCSMAEIAAMAAKLDFDRSAWKSLSMSVVPITAGLGIIEGFSRCVCAVVRYLGAECRITGKTDVCGLYEAYRTGGCQIYADDELYIAVNTKNGKIAENGLATGYGFAQALILAAGGVEGKKVLVMGAGPVGRAAAGYLTDAGADVVLCDHDGDKLARADGPYEKISGLGKRKFSLILEATDSGNTLGLEHVTENAIVSAPGMPLGVTDELRAFLQAKNHLIHNPLELGTAVMLMMIA